MWQSDFPIRVEHTEFGKVAMSVHWVNFVAILFFRTNICYFVLRFLIMILFL